jgi:Flp pilus assembly protein CpaB
VWRGRFLNSKLHAFDWPIRQEDPVTEPSQAPRPSSNNYTFLIVAVAIGAVATMMAFFFLSSQAKKEAEMVTISVYTAAHNIANGSPLDTSKDLTPIDLPATPQTKRLAQIGFTVDAPPPNRQRVNRPIPAGSLILKSDLGGIADFDFVGKTLPVKPSTSPGPTYAMSVPVQGANALSGLLVPGDYVKVIITRPGTDSAKGPTFGAGQNAPSGYKTTVLFGEDLVRVLAVGQRFTRSRQELLTSGVFEAQRESENVKTVTLELTQEQAEKCLQETGGNIWPVTLVLPNLEKPK